MPRKYSPIWNQLKVAPHKCALLAHSSLHARIVKAVIKEKYMDTGFKLLASTERKNWVLAHSIIGKRIEFWLECSTDLQGINSQEL